MKCRVSLTINEDTLIRIRAALRSKRFRNKSHFFEIAAEEMLGEKL